MNKIFGAVVAALAVTATGAAFASSEQTVPSLTPPIYSALGSQTTGLQASPPFGGKWVRTQANVAARTGDSEATQDFAGRAVLSGEAISRFALAAADDYRFEVIGRPIQNGGIGKLHQADSESLVFVRLVRKQDGMPVPNAPVRLSQVDMAPDGMGGMTARSYVRPRSAPGEYRVEILPLMAGRWAGSLAAQVAGEAEPASETLTVSLAK